MKITKVYRYGLLSPTEGAEKIEEQLEKANQYKNMLTEIEITYRKARHSLLASVPDLNALRLTKDLAERTPAYKEAADAYYAAERKYLKSPEGSSRHEPMLNERNESKNRARRQSGLYWGTYSLCEVAADMAASQKEDPKFKSYDGTGSIGVRYITPITSTILIQGISARGKLSLIPQPVPGRKGKPIPRLLIQIGYRADESPDYGEWPIIYHRELPEDAVITWIKVIKQKVATRVIWSAHVTVNMEIEEKSSFNSTVAIDLRWKKGEKEKEPALRLCDWTDGNTSETVMIEPEVLGQLTKSNELRCVRDNILTELKKTLIPLLGQIDLTPEHKLRVDYISMWKSHARMSRLANWWRDNRITGDDTLFELLSAWSRKNHHLWMWEAHARQRGINRRRDQCRVLSARLSEKYDSLVIEKLDLRGLAKEKEDEEYGKHVGRSQRVQVSPSILRLSFINAFKSKGKPVFQVEPGPINSVWTAWKEGKASLVASGTTMSKRQKRFRKIPITFSPKESTETLSIT